MKHYCTVCHNIHEGKCKRPRYVARPRNSQADCFRNTQSWRKAARRIRERDRFCCRVCLKAGVIESRDLSVHHIIPLAVDLDRRLDDDNLITLCRYHHERAEQGQISKQELRDIATSAVKLPRE